MLIITTTTGQENFPNCSCKTFLFYKPSREYPGKERHLAYTAKDGEHGIRRNGTTQMTLAAPRHIDQYGKWFRNSFEVPEGLVLKLFAQRKMPEQQAGRHAIQNLYLRCREEAPLVRVSVRTTAQDIGSFNTVHTEGRFDVLTAADLGGLGVAVDNLSVRFLDDNIGLISVEEIRPALAAAPVIDELRVRNPDGEEVVVRRTRRPRALSL